MELKEIIQVLNFVWIIFVAAGGFFLYKVIPYIKTKIILNKYYNIDSGMMLLGYEVIGTSLIIVVQILCAINYKNSTLDAVQIEINKYTYVVTVVATVMYIFGIIWYVKRKIEKKNRGSYFLNILAGVAVYAFKMFSSNMVLFDKFDNKGERTIDFVICGIILMQFLYNIELEMIKTMNHVVSTSEGVYITSHEPVKKGKYYFIKITDEKDNVIKIVQMSEEKISKIEHIVESLKINKNENKLQKTK